MIERTPEQIIVELRGQIEDREKRLDVQRAMTVDAQARISGEASLRRIAEKQRSELQAKNEQLEDAVKREHSRADGNYSAWAKEVTERQRIAKELLKLADENQANIALRNAATEMNNDLINLQNDTALWVLCIDRAAQIVLKSGRFEKLKAYATQLHDNPPDDIYYDSN